jgi:CHAD domain-containing protein
MGANTKRKRCAPSSNRAGGHVEPKYHLKHGEPIGKGFGRIASEQITAAIQQLSRNGESLDARVHEARKNVKKTRAVLRLLRSAIGKLYRRENRTLQEVSRKLSELRDAQALIEIFDRLNAKYRNSLGNRTLMPVRHGLVQRKTQLSKRFHASGDLPAIVETLHEVCERIGNWPMDNMDLSAALNGIVASVRRGKRAFDQASANPRPENFHEWRKRAKDLRYQLGLLGKAWPAVFAAYEESARDLEQHLGDDHNLAVLRDTVLQSPDRFGADEQLQALMPLIDAYQQELREQAEILGRRLYADKPKQWRKRVSVCWSAWAHETSSAAL